MKATGKLLKRSLLASGLTILLVLIGAGDFRPTAVDLLIAPYRYSFVDWEVSHLPEKWLSKAWNILSWGSDPDRNVRISRAQEFFELGVELRQLEREVQFSSVNRSNGMRLSPFDRGPEASIEQQIKGIKERRRGLEAEVEETIESEVNAVLASVGLTPTWGAFPPVDVVFASSPHVLVLSPRDRIDPQRTVLLNSGLSNQRKEEIEQAILRGQDLAALVENTGGVAVYPSVVADSFGLHHAVVTTAHEWLHHWFFFRPLGRNFWSNQEMTILNETAATIAGEEIGDLVFAALTGQAVGRDHLASPAASKPEFIGFDFDAEMRETRARVEKLLGRSMIEEAEAYMEERRQLFVANGHLIRKINQAYFAFHGTYATSPASVSPIGDQTRQLRAKSRSLEEFLRTIAGFGAYQEFLDHLAAG